MLVRATYDEANDNNTSDNESENENAEAVQDDEVDAIARLVAVDKRTSCNY